MKKIGLIKLDEACFERIWGGRKLASHFRKPLPEKKPIGEAWLVSDHPVHVSAVVEGAHRGKTLHELLEKSGEALLGRMARPTREGRFPLLLKLLDAKDVLSVQVHPDDEHASLLGEPDSGKTEMWHVLAAAPGSELICGLEPFVTAAAFQKAIKDQTVQELMVRFPAPEGTSVFVPAGTVHAIGKDILLAEIQQNSDLTYRIYDWGRLQADGTPRELHIEKACRVTRFGSSHRGANTPLTCTRGGAQCEVLAACRFFAAELIHLHKAYARDTRGDSFHIVLCKRGKCKVAAQETEARLQPGECLLVPASARTYQLEGNGQILTYYVPDLAKDVVEPLLEAGHDRSAVARLGGDPAHSDLTALV